LEEVEVEDKTILDKPPSYVELPPRSLLSTGPTERPARSWTGKDRGSSSLQTPAESSGVDTCCRAPSLPWCPCNAHASLLYPLRMTPNKDPNPVPPTENLSCSNIPFLCFPPRFLPGRPARILSRGSTPLFLRQNSPIVHLLGRLLVPAGLRVWRGREGWSARRSWWMGSSPRRVGP